MLPNNSNVVMSRRAGGRPQLEDRSRVVPSRSLQAGLAAMVAFDPAAGVETNAAAMRDALAAVATGAVTVASRDVELDGVAVRSGAWLGLADGEPVAGGDSFDEVARRGRRAAARASRARC